MRCRAYGSAQLTVRDEDEQHVKYAAMDAYTSYEMYRRIVDMRNCLLPDPDEGSSHIAVEGVSQEVDD